MHIEQTATPEDENEHHLNELPQLGRCRTRGGRNHSPIQVEIDGASTTLKPGDVVKTTNGLGCERHYFIKGKKGFIITRDLCQNLYLQFYEREFSRALDNNTVTVYRDPWGLRQ